MGPIIIFDKSTLQSLSIDESCWLDKFFLSNITPIFYVETLADLEKEYKKDQKPPEQIIKELVTKTPVQGSYPNVYHQTLIINDLLGYKIEMSNRPIIAGGTTRKSSGGQIGVHFNEFSEIKAMQRWQEGNFLEVEQKIAKKWRQTLSNLNFDSMISLIKNILPKNQQFKDFNEIKKFVDDFVVSSDKEILYLCFEILVIPGEYQKLILDRWLKEKTTFNIFAPYAAYVLKIDLFFYLAMGLNLISKERPSHKVDLSYLYYLPFCMTFVSNDKLHKNIAPIFMESEQLFIDGQELKKDLKKLDEYYSKFPEEVKERGIMQFVTYPPEDIENLTSKLWDKFLPIWRKHSAEKKSRKNLSEPSDKKIIADIKQLGKDPIFRESVKTDDADYVIFKRSVPVRKGKWRMVSEEIAKSSDSDKNIKQ